MKPDITVSIDTTYASMQVSSGGELPYANDVHTKFAGYPPTVANKYTCASAVNSKIKLINTQ